MEIMIKRPDLSGLVTTISLTAAETKTPIVNDIYIYIYIYINKTQKYVDSLNSL